MVLAIVYGTTIAGLAREWASSPDASYGLVLAAVAFAVAWKRRAMFMAAGAPPAAGASGFALLACGLLLYTVGQLGADVFLTRVSLVIVLAGTVWFAGGTARIRAA